TKYRNVLARGRAAERRPAASGAAWPVVAARAGPPLRAAPGLPRQPVQGLLGLGRRPVLEPHVPIVAGALERRQDVPVVDLARPGLVSAGDICDLDVPDPCEVLDQPVDELSFHPLEVIAVVLEPDVGLPHLADDVQAEREPVEEVPRALPPVEHLDKERDAG